MTFTHTQATLLYYFLLLNFLLLAILSPLPELVYPGSARL